MQTISNTIDQLHLGQATTFEGLTVFPLLGDQDRPRDYLTLDEALAQNQARVVEVTDEGDVPNLLFDNLGDHKVLLVDGDELIGAKQNRIINLSILVPPHTKVEIPVSCVEAGRWSYHSHEFESKKRSMYSRARAAKADALTMRMRRTGERRADQSEVWDNIAACSADYDVVSTTASMSDIYDSQEARLKRYKDAFGVESGQIGAVFAADGKVQGLELFDSSETFSHYLERLVSSNVLGSLSARAGNKAAARQDVEKFIDSIKETRTEPFKALGEGEDLRLSGETLAGGALVAEDRVVHLAAFNLDPDNKVAQRRPRHWFSEE